MTVMTGRVVGGKVIPEGRGLREGAQVTIVSGPAKSSFRLSAEDEGRLLFSVREADRGDVVPEREVMSRLWHAQRGSDPDLRG